MRAGDGHTCPRKHRSHPRNHQLTLSLAMWGCSGSALEMGHQHCSSAPREQPIPIPFQAGAMAVGDHPQGEGQVLFPWCWAEAQGNKGGNKLGGRGGLGLSVQAQEISGPEIFIRADAAPAVMPAVSDGTGGFNNVSLENGS